MKDANSPSVVYAFDAFRLEPQHRVLADADGRPVEIAGKAFDALLYLVERAGTVVTREELMKALWPQTIVEDNSLNKLMTAVRQALGGRQCIVTLQGRGYQFVADVRISQASPTTSAPVDDPRERSAIATPRRYAFAAVGGIVAVAVILTVVSSWQRANRVQQARSEVIPEIARLVDKGDYLAAFERARDVEHYVADDPLLNTLKPLFTATYSVTTSPPGAEVFVRGYNAVADQWQALGRTPIAKVGLPRRALRWRVQGAGLEPIELATVAPTDTIRTIGTIHHAVDTETLDEVLQAVGAQPPDMVYVPGGASQRRLNGDSLGTVELAPFFIDRYEVTNNAYREFIEAGGYERRSYWDGLNLSKDGQPLSFDQAMKLFVDATGRPGPSTWELGHYPEGQGEYPVTGISWYEASAYARYRGKSLPTVYHWTHAALPNYESFERSLAASILPLSNFGTAGPAAVGSHQAVGPYGAYDMFGNAREWVLNQGPSGGYTLGGGWEDPAYSYGSAMPTALLERSRLNGFRLMRDAGGAGIAAALLRPVNLASRQYAIPQPVSDEVFAAYAREFAYRPGELHATTQVTLATTEDWIKQRVTIDTGYNGERMDVILFVPTRFKPPFQPVVVVSGIQTVNFKDSSDNIEPGFPGMPLDYVVKSGRVFVQPILQGTFERWKAPFDRRDEVRTPREWIERRWDLGRTIDYLETRPDVDVAHLGYIGVSFGASYALPLVALEPRLKAAVFLSGGFSRNPMPPLVEPVSYAPRIKIPVLMVNGRFDDVFPPASGQLPLFELLGTAAPDKRYVLLDSGHGSPPRAEVLRETLGWFDKYLGPVR